MTLAFVKQPLTREVARHLRAATRKVPPLDGHRFLYTDLKELWATEDGEHLVLTHDLDPIWQYWHRSPTGGMALVCCRPTRIEAQRAAEAAVVTTVTAGKYVLAQQPGGRVIRVACRSEDPSIVRSIFDKLGYTTSVQVVA